MNLPRIMFFFICISSIAITSFCQKNNLNLPDLLLTENLREVNSSEDWENLRRPEVLELFEKYVYGRMLNEDLSVNYKNVWESSNGLCGKAVHKEVLIQITNGKESHDVNLSLFLPKSRDKSVPLFIGLNFYGNHTIHPDTNITITESYVRNNPVFCITDNKATHLSRGVRANRWPVERIIERGFGLATIYYGDLDPDYHDGFKNGIHSLIYGEDEEIKADEGGSITAWAYGLSKAMDYFEKDHSIDHNKIIVIGHSRLGKTALWAGALDSRFAVTISNNSGCGGAALSRRKSGETLKDINSVFPHWFCKNFHNFNDKEDELPVDQHMLIALIAPRAVYIGSAEKDKWADPYGEYLSLYSASPVYRLYGQPIFSDHQLPELNSPVIKGNMGYHIRSGSHDVTKYDWEKYMDFADLILSKQN